MLYIASALTPTAILDTKLIPGFTTPESRSLIVAKPDRIEAWDTEETGLVKKAELEVWGSIVGIEIAVMKDARPHILVLQGPPDAHLLLVTYVPGNPALVVTSSIPLTPPTPSLRQAEFFTSVIPQDNVAIVSLWVGVLSCIELEVEKDKDAKKRRASVIGIEEEGKRLKFRDNFNINIREHNLLHLAFLPESSGDPMLTFLWLNSSSNLMLQPRRVSLTAHAFTDVAKPLDVVTPQRTGIDINGETDFNDVPFSCPAARRVLPINDSPMGEKLALVIGDEFSTLYSISLALQSPRISRSSLSGANTSPRAANTRRSPQTEMVSGTGKRRKSSITQRQGSLESGEKWEVKPVWRIRQGFGTVLAATVLSSSQSGACVLLGDEAGRLTAVGWEFDRTASEGGARHGSVRVSKVDLGSSSPPSSLTYLDAAHVFLSSACGDSAVIRLDLSHEPSSPVSPSVHSSARAIPARRGKGKARQEEEEDWAVVLEDGQVGEIDTLERWMNLAPVKDFCTVEEEGGGVSHLVVASGAANANSLRVVRSGVGMEETIRVLGIEDVEGMWALMPTSGSPSLLLSTSTNTTVLHLEPEIAEAEIASDIAGQPTLTAALVPGTDILVQVTPDAITLWSDLRAGNQVSVHKPEGEDEIVAAQIFGDKIVIGTRSGQVAVVAATHGQLELKRSILVEEGEIAAVAIHETSDDVIIAYSTWSNKIHITTLTSQEAPHTELESVVASFLLITQNTPPRLLAGLSDGSMITYELQLFTGVKGASKKVSSLGMRPLSLCRIDLVDAKEKTICVGLSERMSVVFESKGRVDFSSASKKDVTAAASVKTSSGESLVLATPTGLSFVSVTSLKKLQVQTLDTHHRSPTKLTSISELKMLGIASTSRTMDPQNGDVVQTSYFELRDQNTLDLLAELQMQECEDVTCVQGVFLNGRYYFAVGTAIYPSDEEFEDATYSGGTSVTAKEGRLLLLEPKQINDQWELEAKQIGADKAQTTSGPVHDIAVVHGFLAVAVAGKVTIYKSDAAGLERLSDFSSAFIAQHLHVTKKSQLIVGDGMRSIFVLDVDDGSGKIYVDQRDMATHSVTALEGVRDGGESVIIADGYTNLITMRLGNEIETAATFGLHEDVARFRPGSLVPPSSAAEVMTPDLLFATSDGRLGIIGELTSTASKTLDDLQRNMDKYYKGPGGISWKGFRRGGTELLKKETAGFIDGDFVQKFLEADLLPSSETDKILTGSNPHEHISRLTQGGIKEDAEMGDVVRLLEAARGLH